MSHTPEEQLWGHKEIGAFTNFCAAHVKNKIVKEPDFPKPFFVTSDARRNPRWLASEVVAWARKRAAKATD
jgi:predicted DNA-binding transcriptional regulator AlpA